MARIIEEGVVVVFSQITRNDDKASELVNEDVMGVIESAMNELYGKDGVVVEVKKAESWVSPKD